MQLTMTLGIALALAACSGASPAQTADRAEIALQGAMKKETVDGDLKGAIDAYRKVAQAHRTNRSVAARALVRLGQCYDKLGNAESRKAYEQVIREFSDQADSAATARVRLAQLAPQQKPVGVAMHRMFPEVTDRAIQVSPDKRWLIYLNKLGDYHLRDNTTGESRQFTHRLPGEMLDVHHEAVFHNDSRQVAFVMDTATGYDVRVGAVDQPAQHTVFHSTAPVSLVGWLPDAARLLLSIDTKTNHWNLHSLSISDGATRLVKENVGNASVSRDGKLVAYSRGGSHIRLLNLEDMSDLAVSEHPSGNWLPRILPQNRGIVFRSDRRGVNDVWFQALSGGKPSGAPELIKTNTGDLMEAAGIANDGTIYYRGRTRVMDVYLGEYDLATGKWLVAPRKASRDSTGLTNSAAFTPDGQGVSYMLSKGPYPSRLSLVLSSLSGTVQREIPTDFAWVEWHAWLPDGKSILVQGKASDQLRYGIYRFDLASRQTKLLRLPWSNRPAIGPDGIAYLAMFNRLIAYNPVDGSEREVAKTNGISGVSLSPDGKSLAFSHRESTTMAVLETIGVDGTSRREILRKEIRPGGIGGVGNPTWLHDGESILVLSGSGNVWWPAGLQRIPATGGTPVRIGIGAANTQVDGKTIAWPVWSPNGRHVAVEAGDSREELYAIENIVPSLR